GRQGDNRPTGSRWRPARRKAPPAGLRGLPAPHFSPHPPLMLVSIDKRTSALQTVLAARHFALNFLPREALEIADMFGGKGPQKGAERFAPARWGTLQTGAPILLDPVGAIACRLLETIDPHGLFL